MSPDLSQFSMHDLFRLEVDGQREILTDGLLSLERAPTIAADLESCMRAAHSIKGAARIVGLGAAVSVAHAMEDCFVAAQNGQVVLDKDRVDLLLRGLDLLVLIATAPETENSPWNEVNHELVTSFRSDLSEALLPKQIVTEVLHAPGLFLSEEISAAAVGVKAFEDPGLPEVAPPVEVESSSKPEDKDRTLRVAAQNLNRLLGLSGELLVESRWLTPFSQSLLRLKRMQGDTNRKFVSIHETLSHSNLDETTLVGLAEIRNKMLEAERFLADRLSELEMFDQRSSGVARRLYDEAIACRMRPFADRIQAFPRMVRDLSHELGKKARLEITGETTQVDRDVLEKLEAPIAHLLRNAIDHGIETQSDRLTAGKPDGGVIKLDARHAAGTLQVSVADDGHGINLERVRATAVRRGLVDPATAARLTEAELLEFLFLPGFTVRQNVTEISGRGVGLDAVQTMVKQLRGSLRVVSEPGQGVRFQMHLPLTVSVVRTLLTEIGGEKYAFPLAFIVNTLTLPRSDIKTLEGRQHFTSEERQIGLVVASQILGGSGIGLTHGEIPVVVVGDNQNKYGVVVDRFLGVRELVVQPLDPRLGKIKDISAGALLENGEPVLIVDVDDLILSVDKLIATGGLSKVGPGNKGNTSVRRKRVLVVDDSLTVRELERKLIESGGYEVEVAVDGADGWNAVRVGNFDMVVTDVDMPRMDGICLVGLIKKDPRLQTLPIMIVSYKDRPEDRQRGLEAGADFYLTKGGFQNEALLQAVRDLIGDADHGLKTENIA